MPRKKIHAKTKVKKKFMQKEGPIVTFSHVVKKFVQRGSPEKKIPAQAVSEKKFVQAENSPPPPPPITFLMVRPLLRTLEEVLSRFRRP